MSKHWSYWVGAALGIAAGITLIVGAIITKQLAYAAWGVTALACTVTGIVTGANIGPAATTDPVTIGAVFTNLSVVAWIVIGVTVAASIVLSIVFPPFR